MCSGKKKLDLTSAPREGFHPSVFLVMLCRLLDFEAALHCELFKWSRGFLP